MTIVFVECLHYSTQYPSGGQRVGDILALTEKQVIHYVSVGWVKVLPQHLQEKWKKVFGKNVSKLQKGNFPLDYSKLSYFKRSR